MSEGGGNSTSEESGNSRPEKNKYLDTSTLLGHVQMLEHDLPISAEEHFGHPTSPQMKMCRIPDPKYPGTDLPIFAIMAVSKRCISAQLVRESTTFADVGQPVEVLISANDQITCTSMIPLELQHLTAADTGIYLDEDQRMTMERRENQGTSLLSGGLSTLAPSPRLAILVGTSNSRVISIEFSVKSTVLTLERRKHYQNIQEFTYLEPLPQTISSGASSETKSTGFAPEGGVTSLQPFHLWRDGEMRTHVWISWGDGTAVRLHHAGFFASVLQKHTESDVKETPIEKILGEPLIKWQTMLPSYTTCTVIPLPKYHPSPLAPCGVWNSLPANDKKLGDDFGDEKQDEYQDQIYEAAVYCPTNQEDFPTMAFYTSENQMEASPLMTMPDVEEEEEFGLTSMIVGGIVGLLTGGRQKAAESSDQTKIIVSKNQKWDPAIPFASMNFDPVKLFAGYEIHDPPRQISHCSIDPEGDLAAIADTLGRVSLIDLSSKSIIRMWKGFRDSNCHWIQLPKVNVQSPWIKSKQLYLLIHCRQRKVIEIYKTRHGGRIFQQKVHRESQVISCRELSPGVGYVTSCYIAHSTEASNANLNQIQKIEFDVPDAQTLNLTPSNTNQKPVDTVLQQSQEAALKLNHLKQLLDDTNVECQSVDVYKSLEKITSLEDLSTALDFLATASILEERMAVEGATFQKLAVSLCKQKLDEAVAISPSQTDNPHIQLLAFKIAYYTQISNAYEVLNRYESMASSSTSSEISFKGHWSVEAAGWTHCWGKITKRRLDEEQSIASTQTKLTFYKFCQACKSPKDWKSTKTDSRHGGYVIYLSDSSRIRIDILARMFLPLLEGDVFSYPMVNQLLEALGIRKDTEYLLKCFGEWFCSLPLKKTMTMFAKESSTNKWLCEVIGFQMDIFVKDQSEIIPMKSLMEYCQNSEELVRVFWLATLCRESMLQVATEKEEETYGIVSIENTAGKWDQILRQLRICLFVSLRLHGFQLGACPMSIKAVNKGDNFSPYQWLAQDELSMSHNHEEVVSLENACRISSHSFDPFLPGSDSLFRKLQNSCFASALSEEERAEHLIDFDDAEDDRLGAMLLYMKPHNKRPELLVAHRALLLAGEWGKTPQNLSILENAIVALKSIDVVDYKRLASAVRLEIWQSRIRPVYRALLMGFDDVQEISPEIVAPLFHNSEWVTLFSTLACTVLDLLNEFTWLESERIDLWDVDSDPNDSTWPIVKDCFILKRLVQKNRPLIQSSLNAHRMMMGALKLSKNMASLSNCIPSFYDLFTPTILFSNVIPHPEEEEKQHAFLQDAIVAYARNYSEPCLDTLHLGDVEMLADLWEFDMVNVRTLFLLSMYEFGKDSTVDELLTKSASLLSVQHFCDDGVDVICRRLNNLLHVQNRPEIMSLLGSLDADMCDWVRERAEKSEPLVGGGNLQVPIGNTHLFGLRLLSMAASAAIAKDERVKIHSLIVLSGTIVKLLDEEETEEISSARS